MTRRYVVSGMVQGVGFRWFVLRQAQRLKLRGWAQNLPDGRVEVVATGSAEAHAELDEILRLGPPSAQVNRIEVADHPGPTSDHGGFDIL